MQLLKASSHLTGNVSLTSSRQRSYCSLWFSFSRAKAEFCSCREETQTSSAPFQTRVSPSCSRLASQRSDVSAAPGAAIKNGRSGTGKGQEDGSCAAELLWASEANKNVSSCGRATRPIDLREGLVCWCIRSCQLASPFTALLCPLQETQET